MAKKLKKIGILGGSFDPPTISHLQLASEALNTQKFLDEIWMVPCGSRDDKKQLMSPYHRLEMVERAIEDYFPRGYPIKVNNIEVENGKQIPTFDLLEMLKEKYGTEYEFHFMMGSDLIPGLSSWHEKMVTDVNFIIFDRKGYEQILDASIPKNYPMPTNYVAIKADENLIGMISSTEVRKRIREAKQI